MSAHFSLDINSILSSLSSYYSKKWRNMNRQGSQWVHCVCWQWIRRNCETTETASVMTCGADKLIVIFFLLCTHSLFTCSLSSVFSPSVCWRHELSLLSRLQSYIFLSEVDEVLQVNVISVGSYVVVDEKVELIFNPVFKDKGQDTGGQLQEEDYPQKHRKLGEERQIQNYIFFFYAKNH